MIPIATNDVARVLMYLLVPPLFFVPILPTWCRDDDKKSHFITGIHERWVLRIVCRTDDGKTSITQTFGVAPLLAIGQRITHISEILMTIGTYQLVILLAIKVEAWLASLSVVYADELKGADTNAGDASIETGLALLNAGGYLI